MTWYGQPYVYKKDDIIVISPRASAHILDALGFVELFEFCGPIGGIRIKNKKVMHYKDVFGGTRMARLQRIAMDLDIPLQEYIKKREAEKRYKAQQYRKKKVVAVQGLIVEESSKMYITCPYPGCGRRYNWHHPSYIVGQCPRWNSKIELEKTEDDKYLIKKLEVDKP